MITEQLIRVVGADGPIGTVRADELEHHLPRVYLTLTNGQRVLLRTDHLERRPDHPDHLFLVTGRTEAAWEEAFPSRDKNTHSTPSDSNGDAPMRSDASELRGDEAGLVVPVVAEEVRIDKRDTAQTHRVRKVTHERQERVIVPLERETLAVERVRVDRIVEAPEQPREEGDVTIIPVMEEVYVLEKRLVVREEVRLTRRRERVETSQDVTLRSQKVLIDGEPLSAPAPDQTEDRPAEKI